LNQILRDWTNYHQSVCSKQTFGKIDWILWQMLYHWAKGRHRNKSKSWIVQKYWHKVGAKKWTYVNKVDTKNRAFMQIF